jgi:hypothetical protein
MFPFMKSEKNLSEALGELSDVDVAYLAGIFDGEGSIHLRRAYGRGHRALRTYSLRVDVACGTHKDAMRRIGAMVGKDTAVQALPTINGNGNKRIAWRVRLHTRQALAFLLVVQPYLLIKADQAKIAIEFQLGKPKRGGRCTAAREAAEQQAKDVLTALNLRGVH